MVLNTLAFNENIVSNYPNVANSSSPVCQWQAPACPRHLASHVGEETALGWSRLGSGEKIENNSRKGDKKRTERDLKLLPVRDSTKPIKWTHVTLIGLYQIRVREPPCLTTGCIKHQLWHFKPRWFLHGIALLRSGSSPCPPPSAPRPWSAPPPGSQVIHNIIEIIIIAMIMVWWP